MTPRLTHQTLTHRGKLARALWQLVWILLYRPTPRLFHGWRRMLLRLFGARLGTGVHPYPSARIWAPWNLKMGDYSCLGDQVECYCVDRIRIGNHVTVSQHSFLCSASRDYTDLDMPLVTAPITVGDRAWIAADVFIGPGITVGEGAVVLARSGVYRDIAPWSIVAGNPAKFLRKRALKPDGFNTEEP